MNKFTRRGFFGLLLAASAWRPHRNIKVSACDAAYGSVDGVRHLKHYVIPYIYKRPVKD